MSEKDFEKELKQPDAFTGVLDRASAWLSRNPRVVSFTLIGMLVCGGIYLGIHYRQEKVDVTAADAFHAIEKKIESPDVAWDGVAKDLEGFLAAHGNSSLAGTARLYQGRTLMHLSKFEEARKAYEAAASVLKLPFRYLALEGEAMALTEIQKWDEAMKIWSELSRAEDNPLRAFHLFHLGMAQEGAKKTAEAVKTYQEFETKYVDSPLIEKARSRLALLRETRPNP